MNPDLMNALGAMQKMQAEVEKAQEELGSITTTAEAGGGMVKVVANGKQEIVSIKLEREVVDSAEIEMLEDLILACTNRALAKAKELADAKMDAITKNNMPSIPGLPFNF